MLDTWWRRERRGGEDKEGDATSDWQCNGSHDDKQETLIFFYLLHFFKSTLQKNSLCPYAWQAHTQEETGSCLLTSSREELSWQRETKRRVVWCPIAMLCIWKAFYRSIEGLCQDFLPVGSSLHELQTLIDQWMCWEKHGMNGIFWTSRVHCIGVTPPHKNIWK